LVLEESVSCGESSLRNITWTDFHLMVSRVSEGQFLKRL
jgi:hypothetical protein